MAERGFSGHREREFVAQALRKRDLSLINVVFLVYFPVVRIDYFAVVHETRSPTLSPSRAASPPPISRTAATGSSELNVVSVRG